MTHQERAQELIDDWERCKHVHYSTAAQFHDAVDIEFLKSALTELAILLKQDVILESNLNEYVANERIEFFNDHLRRFKDKVTIEILKHGSDNV